MVDSPSSSSSYSSSSEDIVVNKIKFLCSYGGRIVPRYPDGKLRYVGGVTRVLAVPHPISYQELQRKMKEFCGCSSRVSIRCLLPSEDLDALVAVTSDEDLTNLLEEYDVANEFPLKIRAFLFASKPYKVTSPSYISTGFAGQGYQQQNHGRRYIMRAHGGCNHVPC